MITGLHAMLNSRDAAATRAFLRDVLGWPSVDAGEAWLICAAPPAEMGVHPASDPGGPVLYLLCDNIEQTVAELRSKGAEFSGGISDQGWGRLTTLTIPGGVEMGLYEPRHPTAIALGDRAVAARR